MTDGAQYTVYSYDEVSMMSLDTIEAAGDMTSHYDSQGRLNINNATLDELMQLKGIGQAKAEAIIQYRDEYGGFTAKEELLNVSGIGDGVYSGIEADITVGK